MIKAAQRIPSIDNIANPDKSVGGVLEVTHAGMLCRARSTTAAYTQTVDGALTEIERFPGRRLFRHPHFAAASFDGMRGA